MTDASVIRQCRDKNATCKTNRV